MIEYLLRTAQLDSMNCKPQWRKPVTVSQKEGADRPMHAENIEAMKREVLRLLVYTVNVLKAVTDAPDLLRESDTEQRRQLDTQKAAKWQGILKDEIKKVKNLEAVFAVVGTVKAGKSTAINAIVGAEILPSRPEPMTTYPTLVRHKPGQTEPVLDFPVALSFNSLARKAKKKLGQQTSKTPLNKLYPDPHEQAIAEKILEDQVEIAARSEGKAEIFELLKTVNDLYRLCGRLELELPTTADRLPTLEIEMHHIGTGDTGVGQFTILDLPGPNESGQSERLRGIVQEQLNRASAVVLVSDFTQRKTQADAEIQKLVKNELVHLTDRLFIFVNKFDQRRADDWGVEEMRTHLSRTLLDGAVAPERIHPVSALRAFLANWAQRQLKEHGRLPDPKTSSLTEDFGRDALGTRWEHFIDKSDEVEIGADELWKESLFADPLDNVIRVAARNASLVCLKAATSKLLEYNQTLDHFLNIRDGATTKAAIELWKAIENLQNDIEKVNKERRTAEERMKARLDDFPQLIKDRCEYCSEQIELVIKEYFKTGNLSPPPKKRCSRLREAWDRLGTWVSEWLSKPFNPVPPSTQQTTPDFSPRQSLRELCEFRDTNHAAQAKKFIERIRDRLQPVYENSARLIEQDLNEVSERLSNHIATDLEKGLEGILEKAKERLQRDFKITLDFPKLELKMDIETLPPLGPDVVRPGSFSEPRSVKKPGLWADIARFFDIFEASWGYKEIQEAHRSSTIDMTDLQDAAMKQLGSFSSETQGRAKELAQAQNKALSGHFDNLKDYLEEFRGDLRDACEDKESDARGLDERHKKIQNLLSDVKDIRQNTQTFYESLEASDGAERPSR